jgi:hypothetical protein
MAITNAQRDIALNQLLTNYGNDNDISHYLPGVTSAQLVTAIRNSIGASFDTQLNKVLTQMIADAQSANSAYNANTAAWTVT